MMVYREACRDRDQFGQEQDAARLAPEAATRLEEGLDTVKRQRDDLQAKLVDAERQGVTAEARQEVLQRSKALKHIESGPGAASPSQLGVPVAPPATYSAQSVQFLTSGLLQCTHLATRLMADAKSSCQQLQTIAVLAGRTTMPDLSLDGLPKVEAEVSTRPQNADRRYRSDVLAAAQQPGWERNPVVGSPGSLPGDAGPPVCGSYICMVYIVDEHFIVLKFLLGGLGPQIAACCAFPGRPLSALLCAFVSQVNVP